MQKKFIYIGIGLILTGAFLTWLFLASSKPLPGQKMADLGRKHVDVGSRVLGATSDPPTSGDHYADWVRSGVYDIPKDDGYLIHSLEHGYVILSYNCEKKVVSRQSSVVSTAYAHGLEEEASQSAEESTSSAALSDTFRSDDCHNLVDQLISIYEKKGKTRLIVIPRPNMDSRIALTAWTYIDKFDPSTSSGLSVSEMERIEKFIDTHLNQGPEKTME